MPTDPIPSGFTDAATFGFSPAASGRDNAAALQRAVDQGGTIVVGRPGTYDIAATVLVGSNTALRFGHGVVLRKVTEDGPFTYVLLNKGARTKTWDQRIMIEGLHLSVNGVDVRDEGAIYGLRGQVSFFYVRDLRIQGLRCHDLESQQFCIHVCTFEDLIVEDVIIEGDKDGVHLGRGKRFVIRDGTFRTVDDAIALNAHDYATSNPELGWIEQGLIENCRDLAAPEQKSIGFFCRILAGAWGDWREGMAVQHSDSVISAGRLYRVQTQPDGAVSTSLTAPTHEAGQVELDGITWGMVQTDPVTTCGVRDVTFRGITLEKPRQGFSIHFDRDRYSRSWYPGSEAPIQQRLLLADVRVLHDGEAALLGIGTPVDSVVLDTVQFGRGGILLRDKGEMGEALGPTTLTLRGCSFLRPGPFEVVRNEAPGKRIDLRVSGSSVAEGVQVTAEVGPGDIAIDSDLPGVR